ncbi:MAG: hypothetical protein PHW10_00025 [Candidatus Peribacteraceae bacterium]|nr:hypothetical protein [Candidatus Peribacteraceae bacterium]
MQKKPTSALRLLLPLLVSGTVVLAVLSSVIVQRRPQPASLPPMTDIAVEHAQPLRLSVIAGSGTASSLIDFALDGDAESASLTLPDTWTLREVRGARLEDVTSERPSLGYIRWSAPRGAVLSLRVPQLPGALVVHNPSQVPLYLHTKRIDLRTGETEEETYLVKDDPKRVW